jgi:dTDP-4-amino-4,6-dideoxygalactose transaminase
MPFIDLVPQQARLKPELDRRIAAVLAHGRYILGPEVHEFEEALATFCGADQAVGVASGTDALLIALMAEGIGPGDAVFVPAFTFPATAEVVLLVGAHPIFVDVEAVGCNIDPGNLDRAVEAVQAEGILTPRAVIAVDLYGLPADYSAIADIVDRHRLFLLSDAAQSFGAVLDNRRVGVLAPVTAASFFPAKPVGCYGDGGALLTDDPERAERFRSIRGHGQGAGKYDIARLGLNSRLDTLQAAILLAKLAIFEDELASRDAIAHRYHDALADVVDCPVVPGGTTCAWAQYTVQLDRRDAVAEAMREAGVPSMVYYPKPLHLQPAYSEYGPGPGSLPVAESLAGHVLSLPMHPYLDAETQQRVIDVFSAAVHRFA